MKVRITSPVILSLADGSVMTMLPGMVFELPDDVAEKLAKEQKAVIIEEVKSVRKKRTKV